MLIIGLDPGLGCTGWGVIAAEGNRLTHVANGQVRTDPKQALPARLVRLEEELGRVIDAHGPAEAAVEEVFLNENPQSTLKLGQARGVVLLAAGRRGLAVGEYAPRLVKKAVVGTGARREGPGPRHGPAAAAVARRSPAPTPPTRSRSRSPTPTISPARAARSGNAGMIARAARAARRLRRRFRGDRRQWRRLSRLRLDPDALGAGRDRRGGRAPHRDAGRRGFDPAGRLLDRRRARLVPPADLGPGRRRPGRARHPLGAVGRRGPPRGGERRQCDDRPRPGRRPQARPAHRPRAEGQGRQRRARPRRPGHPGRQPRPGRALRARQSRLPPVRSRRRRRQGRSRGRAGGGLDLLVRTALKKAAR